MRSGVRGCVLRADVTEPSNYRAAEHLDRWLKARGIIAHHRRRHARAHGAHPRQGHAQRRHRARAVGQVRPRQAEGGGQGLAGPRRHGPRARRHVRARATPGTRRAGSGAKATAAQESPDFHVVAIDYGLKRNILRCLASGGLQGDGRAGHDAAPKTSWSASPTACSCPTARAIRRRPATTPCRRSRSWSPPACRCSASASAIRCWGSRSAPRPPRCIRAITAPTIR